MARIDIPPAELDVTLVRGNLKQAMAAAGAANPHSLWSVPPHQLRTIPGFNGRIRTPAYLEHLAHIKSSIRENGYYQDKPLAGFVAVEDGEQVIYITEGHTRFESVRDLIEEGMEFESIPVVVKPKGTSIEDLTVALVTSNEGRPFTPYEKALMVKRLVSMGMEEGVVAKRLNMTTRYVSDLLTLAAAPKGIRDLVVADKVTATLAIEELTKHGAKALDRLKAGVEKAASLGKPRATAKHMERPMVTKKSKPEPVNGEDTFTLSLPGMERSIEVGEVLKDAEAAGFAVGGEADEKLVRFAATVLDRFGLSVVKLDPIPEPDPADADEDDDDDKL